MNGRTKWHLNWEPCDPPCNTSQEGTGDSCNGSQEQQKLHLPRKLDAVEFCRANLARRPGLLSSSCAAALSVSAKLFPPSIPRAKDWGTLCCTGCIIGNGAVSTVSGTLMAVTLAKGTCMGTHSGFLSDSVEKVGIDWISKVIMLSIPSDGSREAGNVRSNFQNKTNVKDFQRILQVVYKTQHRPQANRQKTSALSTVKVMSFS
jgi:hypothetical protein